jgi:hypothetical protein
VLAPCLLAKKKSESPPKISAASGSRHLESKSQRCGLAVLSGRARAWGQLWKRRRRFGWKTSRASNASNVHCLGSAAVATQPIGSRAPSQREPSLAPPLPFSERDEATINRNQSQRQRYPHLYACQPGKKCLIYHLPVSTKHASMIKTATTKCNPPDAPPTNS